MSIRGLDGKLLWKIKTKSEVFEINCGIDLNNDNFLDCLGSGRKNTFLAFDPRTGSIIWDSSFEYDINPNWNIYNPLILDVDFDNDGCSDIIISAGGNPTIPSDQHDREPGFIYVISGSTGKIIGKKIIGK